jgi:ketosteroid isomerase-like protein
LELVQQRYMAFGRGDVPGLLAGMADDMEWDSRYPSVVPFGGQWRGHDGVTALIGAINDAIEVLAFEIHDFISEGDKVVVLGSEDAKAKSTGRSYHNEWVHVWTVRDGQAVSMRNYNDTAAVVAAFS